MSVPEESKTIDRRVLLNEAQEAHESVRLAFRRDRGNTELALRFVQSSCALSALLNDCTPPQIDPAELAAKQAQTAVLGELAAAFKGVERGFTNSIVMDDDGLLRFEVLVYSFGSDPDLVKLTLGEAGAQGKESFVTYKAVEAYGMARSLVAAGAGVAINVTSLHTTASTDDTPSAPGDVAGEPMPTTDDTAPGDVAAEPTPEAAPEAAPEGDADGYEAPVDDETEIDADDDGEE